MPRDRLTFNVVPKMKLLCIGFAGLALVVSSSHAEDADERAITPKLGAKFGEIIEIEGIVVGDDEPRMKKHASADLIRVLNVSDRKLEDSILIEFLTFGFAPIDIPEGGTLVRLKGYETGGFRGIPQKAFDDIPTVATTGFHFESLFQAIKRLHPKNGQNKPVEASRD